MKMKQWILSAVAGMVLAGSAVAGDEFYLVKISNYDRSRDVMTMSAADFKALEKTLKQEEKYFAKAVADVAKDWRADELNKGIPFPGGRLVKRAIVTSQKFPTAEKADEQLTRHEDQEARKAQRAAAKTKGAKVKKPVDPREEETARAVELVKTKIDEYVAKAGAATTEPAAANLPEAGKEAPKGAEGKDQAK